MGIIDKRITNYVDVQRSLVGLRKRFLHNVLFRSKLKNFYSVTFYIWYPNSTESANPLTALKKKSSLSFFVISVTSSLVTTYDYQRMTCLLLVLGTSRVVQFPLAEQRFSLPSLQEVIPSEAVCRYRIFYPTLILVSG